LRTGHVSHTLRVVPDLTSAGDLAIAPRGDAHHVKVVRVNHWWRLTTSCHWVKEIILVIVVIESVDRLRWRRSASAVACRRAATHTEFLLSELDFTLSNHQLPLTKREVV
jgi:hypothetical protein